MMDPFWVDRYRDFAVFHFHAKIMNMIIDMRRAAIGNGSLRLSERNSAYSPVFAAPPRS